MRPQPFAIIVLMETVLVLRTIHWDCWTVKLDALLAAAQRRGWRLQLVDRDPTMVIGDLLKFWKPIGVVVVESGPTTVHLHPKIFGKIPVVYLDPNPKIFAQSFAYVHHDAKEIVNAAVKEFLSIGCQHLAYVGWPETVHWSEDKRVAFSNVLRMHGKQIHELCPRKQPSKNSRNSVDTFARIKKLTKFIASLPTPCGILAVNDLIAWQVLSVAQAAGKSIPDDIAVIGVDNDPIICEKTDPTLSSFELDFQGAGEAAMSIIENWSVTKRPCHHIKPLRLVRRQSTNRLPQKDQDVEKALELIRLNACSGISAHDVFPLFKCSRRMAELRFRKVTGISILKEIQNRRMEKACELLRFPKLRLDVIANQCGFRSTALFFRQFKAATGFTPLQWSKSKR